MNFRLYRAVKTSGELQLLFLSGIIALACLAYIPFTPGPILPDIPAIIIPIAISLGLGLFTVRAHQREYESDELTQLALYGWIGTLVSAAIGGWWIALHFYTGVPIVGLTDQILTVVSSGLGVGVLMGSKVVPNQRAESSPELVVFNQQNEQPTDRNRVISEVTWTNRTGSHTILDAVVEVLAELEEVDPWELDPLYKYVNPDAISELQIHDGPHWQLLFYTDKYEIRISSSGTVTAYETDFTNRSGPLRYQTN